MKKRKGSVRAIAWGAVIVACFSAVQAEDRKEVKDSNVVEKVVVTADRTETPLDRTGSSVTVITREELERTGKPLVADALRGVPGLDVVRTGGVGGSASVFLRGANSEHTLVLVDGVEMNDPIAPARGFDFADLAVNNIERIEILRGPASTLYGSDALGGVIQIITRKGAGKPAGELSLEGGSFSTFRETAAVRGGSGRLGYSIGLSRLDTGGISAADERDGNREKDGFGSGSASARLHFQATKAVDLGLVLRITDSEADLDNFGGAFGDDVNHRSDSRRLATRVQAGRASNDGRWKQRLAVSYTDYDRSFDNPVDVDHPIDESFSSFESSLLKFDRQSDLKLNDRHKLVFGVETEEEKGSSTFASDGAFGPFSSVFAEETSRTTGWYLQDQVRAGDRWNASLGARVDDHDRFGTKTTYRGAFSWKLPSEGTRLKGSYGTGFKAPSLFQLFSSFGNLDLAPEESTGWDVGVEQTVPFGNARVSLTGFRNDFENLIDFDFGTFTYRNIAEAKTRGLELEAAVAATESIDLSAGATWTSTEDRSDGSRLLRRPAVKYFARAHLQPSKALGLNLHVTRVGARDDFDFVTSSRVSLDAYTLVDLSAEYRLSSGVRLFVRLENLLDESYQDGLGYGSPGLGGSAGVEFSR